MPAIIRIVALSVMLLLVAMRSSAQIDLHLSGDPVPEEAGVQDSYRDSLSLRAALTTLVVDLRTMGYITASVDSLVIQGDRADAILYTGPVVQSELGVDGMDADLLSRDLGKESEVDDLPNIVSAYLDYADDHGFPFATVRVIRELTDKKLMEYELSSETGPLVIMDSLIITSEESIDPYTLMRQIGFKKGAPYDGEMLRRVDSRLAALPFLTVARPSQVIFAQDRARLLVFLKKRRADRIDAIVGFQPDAEGRTIFTGEVDLLLLNSFSRAETIGLQWKRVKDNSQELGLDLAYPYLFRSSIGIVAGLQIFRQDTTFNELRATAGLGYSLDNGDVISLFIKSVGYNSLLKAQGNNEDLGTRTTLYGLGLRRQRLDRPYNPRRGVSLDMRISTGVKEYIRSSGENAVEAPESSGSYEGDFDLSTYLPLGKRATALLRGHVGTRTGAGLVSKELYRIGGLRSLRGFDEQALVVSSFAIATAEYRFLTGEQSFFSAFLDYAFTEVNTLDRYDNGRFYGFGVGASLGTTSGVFSMNYALGGGEGVPVELRAGKIHFGYIATF